MTRELARRHDQLRDLLARTRLVEDLEMRSHWGRYLCVLVAGFIEQAFVEIYCNMVARAARPEVVRYAQWSLRQIQNPKPTRFLDVTRTFDGTWANRLAEFFGKNGRKEAVESIMTQRHSIAHGGDSGITVAQVEQHLKRSVEVLNYLERVLTLGGPPAVRLR